MVFPATSLACGLRSRFQQLLVYLLSIGQALIVLTIQKIGCHIVGPNPKPC